MNLALTQTLSKYSPYAITVDEFVQSADEKKIKAVFETMQAAWENNDAKTFTACFTEDSDFVNFRGDHFKGRENNITKHVQFKDTRLYINIKSIRFLNDEMAVVHAEGAVLEEWQQVSNCKLSYNTNILIKENGQWKITSFHNSRKEKQGIITRIMKWFRGKEK
ncbi:SgcJ/EcaC family oxidoreductase [Panacibacter ginsenosidivorans]|uniref:SgcJ/EcaC family oxidoreductase n=1 Tax=Panacibacter ginsenosidivorans TaxID=1813871 RepID=A0A5B8VD59_9BACT|nr:SgcJ/EcaC family oxidoreductase [Panacibacter ginsenosidivorans]QEC68985.1 SgcJ/EcaC family oxidoreductase [Panacibacter ginsenosidivorans]